MMSVAARLAVRERSRAWAAEHRGVSRRQPWLYGAPVYDAHLPGAGLELFSDAPLKWPLEHRNVRGLHGAISTLLDEGHDPCVPRFSLVPWHRGIGWGVYLDRAEQVERLAGTRHSVRVYEQVIELRVGGAMRVKAPIVSRRGRRRLRIDTLTPVCTREAGGIAHVRASGPNLLSTLCAWLPRRLGVFLGDDDARLGLVTNDTHTAHVPLGGKYGTVSGWTGNLVVECNAVVEWLLRAAETLGLGGRVAFGFGRIRVSSAEGG